MKRSFLLFCFLLFAGTLTAQNISGRVGELEQGEEHQDHHHPLAGANVFWLGESTGTATNGDGQFSIGPPRQYPARLVISFVGFTSDTILLNQAPEEELAIRLAPTKTLETLTVESNVRSSGVSGMDILHVENISKEEFQKAACCNLSESFETNASIDAALTDAVSGARKIRMLGLDGIYSQILGENIPYLRGLAAVEGLSYIPGPWVESIQITKGTGSVVNGFEAITGQINIEYLKPDDVELDRYYINLYANRMGRLETNIHMKQKVGKRWSTLLFGHVSDVSVENDNNNDGFLDVPLRRQYNVFNRWKYFGDRIRAQIGLRAIQQETQGGQLGFNYDRDFGETQRYGLGTDHQQVDLFTKFGYLFPKNPNASIGTMTNFRYHNLESFYGLRTFDASERYGYINTIYQTALGDTRHVLKLGASYLYSAIDQQFQDSTFNRVESVPGVFGEYTFTGGVSSLVVGNRFDFHNLYGLYIVPRLHYKYQLGEATSIRFSVGRGIRTANPYNDNAAALASSRTVKTLEDLEPEKAWNGGITFSHEFKIGTQEAFFTADYFRTEFQNQVVVDLENPALPVVLQPRWAIVLQQLSGRNRDGNRSRTRPENGLQVL